MEVMIAVGMFAFGIIGLASALNRMMEVELLSRRDQQVRIELESRYAESRLLPMVVETRSLGRDASGVEYTRIVEEAGLETEEGVPLQGLLRVRVNAIDPADGALINFLEVFVYEG